MDVSELRRNIIEKAQKDVARTVVNLKTVEVEGVEFELIERKSRVGKIVSVWLDGEDVLAFLKKGGRKATIAKIEDWLNS